MALSVAPATDPETVNPSAGTTSCSTNTVLQTEQCFPSVSPVLVQVGSTAASMTSVCPVALISVSPERTSPQTLHFVPAARPGWVQVGSTFATVTTVCPVALAVSVLVAAHAVQVYVFTPVPVQVGAMVILPLSQLCPLAGTTFCSTSTALHTEQCFPSVKPVSVHVGATAFSTTSVCPLAGTTFCSTSTSPQTEQCFPSVSPVLVHVGATALSTTSVWGMAVYRAVNSASAVMLE